MVNINFRSCAFWLCLFFQGIALAVEPELLKTLAEYPMKKLKSDTERALLEYQYAKIQSIELLIVILGSPTLAQGIHCIEAVTLAKRSLATLQA